VFLKEDLSVNATSYLKLLIGESKLDYTKNNLVTEFLSTPEYRNNMRLLKWKKDLKELCGYPVIDKLEDGLNEFELKVELGEELSQAEKLIFQ